MKERKKKERKERKKERKKKKKERKKKEKEKETEKKKQNEQGKTHIQHVGLIIKNRKQNKEEEEIGKCFKCESYQLHQTRSLHLRGAEFELKKQKSKQSYLLKVKIANN